MDESLSIFCEGNALADNQYTSTSIGESTEDCLPQGSIRLLRLVADDAGTEIQCATSVHRIDDCPSYVALSYAWGRPPDCGHIKLNGRKQLIRKNLWRFLSQARKLTGYLWIDALCIDQSDHRERTEQVKLMPQIFLKVESVIIWLGPAYGGSDEAMDGLTRYSACRRRRKDVWNITGSVSIHISTLCRRAYWTRLWVFQEVVLARQIVLMCGTKTAPWAPLKDMLLTEPVAEHEPSIQYQIIQGSPAKSIVARTNGKPGTLFDLIGSTQGLRCTEPRDRVYALLGLNPTGCEDIVPDYDMPLAALMNAVLRNHHKQQQPDSLEVVEKQCSDLQNVLGTSLFDVPGDEIAFSWPIARRGSPVTLWWADYYGHDHIVKLLMADEGVAVATWSQRALAHGNGKALALLLRSGIDMGTELIKASFDGHLHRVKLLLDGGADPNAGSGQYRTFVSPLQAACHRRAFEIMKLLLDRGADDDHKHGWHSTALSKAYAKLDVKAIKLLLNSQQSMRQEYYSNVMHRIHTILDPEVLRLLLRRTPEEIPETVHYAALRTAVEKGQAEHMKLLLPYIEVLRAQETHGSDALHVAVMHAHYAIVKLLLDAGFDVNIPVSGSRYPIQTAAHVGSTEIVQLLLSAGANTSDEHYSIAVAEAAREGHLSVMKLLVSKGTSRRGYGKALREASERGYIPIVKVLLDAGTSFDTIGKTIGATRPSPELVSR